MSGAIAAGAALLLSFHGPRIMAQRCGLTVRGSYNLSAPGGVTESSGAISAINDLSSAGNNYAQGTAGNQPTYAATDAAINNRATATGDGTDDFVLCSTYSAPAPGTTPIYWHGVIKQITYGTPPNFIFATGALTNSVRLIQNIVSPAIRINNGTAVENTGLSVGSWGRVEFQLQNSTADYIKLISTNVTGTNMGNTSGGATGRQIFAENGAGNAANVSLAYLLCCEGTAPAQLRTFLDFWVTTFFGPGLV